MIIDGRQGQTVSARCRTVSQGLRAMNLSAGLHQFTFRHNLAISRIFCFWLLCLIGSKNNKERVCNKDLSISLQVAENFRQGETSVLQNPAECDAILESLQLLQSNHYKNAHPRSSSHSTTGQKKNCYRCTKKNKTCYRCKKLKVLQIYFHIKKKQKTT